MDSAHGLVGRTPFIAALKTAWDEAQLDGMQVICLQGPAGIGKTRLALEFLQDRRSDIPVVAMVRCNRHDHSAPLEPIHALLRQINRRIPGVGATPKALVSELVDALGSARGALFVDDWHWVDDASRSVFQDLASALQDHAILLIVTARETSLDDGLIRTAHQIHVPPMNARETERRAEQVLGRPIDTALKSRIFQKSGGNPLYLEEICRALSPVQVHGAAALVSDALAADLHALVAGRIDQLAAEETKVLFAIAVHGETVDQKLLADVLTYKVPQIRFDYLCSLDLLRPDLSGTQLQFRHGITRDVAYGMIPDADRTALHTRYFDAILAEAKHAGTSDFAESLALHAEASGNLVQAIEFSEQAGDKALAASSLDQAERQFNSALTSIDQLDQGQDWRARWLSIALRWARPCVYAASIEHLPVLEKAQAIAIELGDDERLAEIFYWTGYNLYVRGKFVEAISLLRRSQSLAKTLGLARLEIEAMAIIGCGLSLQARYEEAGRAIDIALGAKDRHPVAKGRAPVTSVYLQAMLALIDAEQGRFDIADDKLETALARIAEFEHEIESSILSTGCAVLLWRGRWEKARDYANRARQRSERTSASYMIGTSGCLFSYADWKLTGNPDSLARLERTAHWLDRQGMRLFLTLLQGLLCDALADAGRFEEAARVALRVLACTEESGECLGAAMAARTLARCAMSPGGAGLVAAGDHLRVARKWAGHRTADHEHGACALLEAQVFALDNRPEAARASLNEAIEIFQRLGMTPFLKMAQSLAQTG